MMSTAVSAFAPGPRVLGQPWLDVPIVYNFRTCLELLDQPDMGEEQFASTSLEPLVCRCLERAAARASSLSRPSRLSLDEMAALFAFSDSETLFGAVLSQRMRESESGGDGALQPWIPFLRLLHEALSKLQVHFGDSALLYSDAVPDLGRDEASAAFVCIDFLLLAEQPTPAARQVATPFFSSQRETRELKWFL
jgi:hypothetical protein